MCFFGVSLIYNIKNKLVGGSIVGTFRPENAFFDKVKKFTSKRHHKGKEQNKIPVTFPWIEIPGEFTKHSVGDWSKCFLKWLSEVELSTEYGRKIPYMHIEQLVRLLGMLLQETRTIRSISRQEPFSKTIRLLTSVRRIGITTAVLLMVEIDEIKRFSNSDSPAAFIGLTPT